MDTNKFTTFPDDKDWIEKLSEQNIFEQYITDWIVDCKRGVLTKDDILNVTKKVSDYRCTPFLIEEIRQRLN